jgi:site-specific DNA-methyltransferase (adenine-specific)
MQRSKDYPSVPESRFPGWMVEVLTAAKPKLTDNASIMINAREHVKDGTISDYLLRTRLALREIGLFEIDTLIWHKPDAPPTGRPDRPRRAYEHIYWFSPSRDPFTAVKACGTEPVEKRERMTRTRTLKSGHYTEQSFQRFNGDMTVRVTDVVVASHGTSSAKIKHPSPYPLSLADQLVRTYSPVGSLVCDPMCGSGTTCLAAKQADRNWVGFDVVPRFVREAQARLDKA